MTQATRKSASTLWNEASIKALEAERKKHAAEQKYYEALVEEVEYGRMERETWDRARRTYDLSSEVTEESAAELVAVLSDWATESDERITLRLMSPGGSTIHGLAIYDFVVGTRNAGVPIDTLALGWAASMASVLLQCGEVRKVAPNASILIHESRFYYDEPWMEKISDMKDRAKFEESIEKRCDAILAERSTLTIEQLRRRYERKDWWLTAQEAVTLGFADELWVG